MKWQDWLRFAGRNSFWLSEKRVEKIPLLLSLIDNFVAKHISDIIKGRDTKPAQVNKFRMCKSFSIYNKGEFSFHKSGFNITTMQDENLSAVYPEKVGKSPLKRWLVGYSEIARGQTA